jgi:hypothetical protein
LFHGCSVEVVVVVPCQFGPGTQPIGQVLTWSGVVVGGK